MFSFIMKAEVSQVEKNALIQLYNATNGANWTSKWDLKAPVTSWYGVKVQADKVVSIQLQNNNLVGTLPSSIGDLRSLEVLNLSFNKNDSIVPFTLGTVFRPIDEVNKPIQALN